MYNPRLFLIPTLFLLGSCAPLQTQPQGNISITINTSAEPQRVDVAQSLPDKPTATETKITAVVASCHQMTLEEVKSYKLPPKPDLTKINYRDPSKVDTQVGDALVDNINVLRRELERRNEEFACALQALQNKS